MCLFRCPHWLNALSHKWHLYGFSPLWILLWRTRWAEVVNRLLQTVHSNGFSPEWLRLWCVKSWLLWKHFPHSVHLYLLLWTFIWILNVLWVVKRFSHWLHVNNFSPVCVCLWSFKYLFLVNRLSHTVHKYDLGLSSCRCTVISLLSASIFTSKQLSPVQHTQVTMYNITHCKQSWKYYRCVLKIPVLYASASQLENFSAIT